MLNKKVLQPLALTGMVSLLAACGGESASVNEDPNQGPQTSSNGCYNSDSKCQTFFLDYPVRGMNFDCSSDTNNHFITVQQRNEQTGIVQNVVSGGCALKDKVQFYIQGPESDKKINLGNVDLNKLNPLYVAAQPTQIGILNIAEAMTGKEAVKADMTDETFRVMVALIHIFQAVGVDQKASTKGEIQPIEFDNELKNKLNKIEASVDVKDFKDGSYVAKLAPWLKLTDIDEETAIQVAKDLLNLSAVRNYKADFMALKNEEIDLGGFHGESLTGLSSISSYYGLTTRQGYSIGYALQWAGKPVIGEGMNLEGLDRLLLLTQAVPQKLDVVETKDWVNPFNTSIQKPLSFFNAKEEINASRNLMEIYKGKFLNGNNIAGNEFMYKRITGEKNGPSDSSVYGAWRQSKANERFTGNLDIYKTNPATYLDKRVFLTEANVNPGDIYLFPLYLTLTLDYGKQTELKEEKISIVIDEFGDIRTNMSDVKDNELVSDACPSINQDTYVDSNGVQQYRIGTTGAANYSTADKSITVRMILSNPKLKNLDGAIIGLNDNLMWLISGNNSATFFESGGVRLNLQNLIVNKNTSQPINITGWSSKGATTAEWGNMLALMQNIYNSAEDNKNKVTPEQLDLAKRGGGNIRVDYTKCYQVKTKI